MAFYEVTVLESGAAVSVATAELYEVQPPPPGTRGLLRAHQHVNGGQYVLKFDNDATWNVELRAQGGPGSKAFTVHSSEAAPVRRATLRSE